MNAPKLFTIPPEADFMRQLAQGILADSQLKKIPLPDYLVLLPTRRACTILREALQQAAAGQALLLPRLQPIGDINAEELTLAEAGNIDGSFTDIPPAITPLARCLELGILLRRHDSDLTADAAWLRASALAALLDQTQIERLDFAALRGLVREDLAEHWQKILDFLEIVTSAWPRHLAARELIDPATQRDLLIARRAALWAAQPPRHPVIAAGSTGSMPATADLLAVIAGLPHGAVILPGLDQTSAAETWDAVDDATHPQFLLKNLLEKIGCRRDQVKIWHETAIPENDTRIRAAMLQTALAPPEGAAHWRTAAIPSDAWQGITQCVCETLEEEARIIALTLRETLETPGRTAALVTRDRKLAARVAAQLRRWDITIDDSAGQDLTTTPCGAFLLLTLAAARPDTGAGDLLALLQHPLTALGGDPSVCRTRARLAERVLWRGRRVRGPVAAHAHVAAELARAGTIKADDAHELAELFASLEYALRPLTAAIQPNSILLPGMLEAHMAAAENLAAATDQPGAQRLWQHDDGIAAAALLHELMQAAADTSEYTLARGDEYIPLLRQIFSEQVVRPRYGTHPRLSILGPLEARFVQADTIILGGLNEGSWPPTAGADPWLSRPMRKDFGLPAFERQIGQAAHDFVQLASRGQIILTRARRVDGQPTTPSRFLWRLDTLRAACDHPEAAPFPTQEWARRMDAPASVKSMEPPHPCPAIERRPTRFSVTEIGRWRGNPYGFYAKHVLRLKPLGDLDPDFSHAEQGTIIHAVLHDFVSRHLRDFPSHDAALEELLRLGRAAFKSVQDQPAIYATCWARFENSARWFVAAEAAQRSVLKPVALETQAALPIAVDGMIFQLRGKPDRIDLGADGLVISDYKTGAPPSDPQIESGYEPQLPLLGMMAARGAFAELGAQPVVGLRYLQLKGRANAADACREVKDPQTRIAAALAMLESMLRTFKDPAMPYLVCPQPRYIPRYDDYAHLGRIDEWGAPGDAV